MPTNAMTGNQQRQAAWLRDWQQRQRNKSGYNASWMPKDGWRGRFNQSQQPQTPWTPQRPNVPNPQMSMMNVAPAAPARPLGFNTLAPVGVPEGGWGGGAIQQETAPAAPPIDFSNFDPHAQEMNSRNPTYHPEVAAAYAASRPPAPAPLTGRAGQDQWLKGWHQRQQKKSGYDASWAPQAGWRGRFNQGGTNAMMEY